MNCKLQSEKDNLQTAICKQQLQSAKCDLQYLVPDLVSDSNSYPSLCTTFEELKFEFLPAKIELQTGNCKMQNAQ